MPIPDHINWDEIALPFMWQEPRREVPTPTPTQTVLKREELCFACGYCHVKEHMIEITRDNNLYGVVKYLIKRQTNDSSIYNAPILKICDECINDNYKLIFPYQYNPKPFCYCNLPNEKTKLYFGIELEIEDRKDVKWHTIIGDLPEFVYCKSDGSLSNGFEIVSHPATFNWLKHHKTEWDKILSLRQKGFASQETNTCGMHIHLSKNAFSNCHLYKFMRFIYRNKSFVKQISQRDSVQELERWASLKETKHITARRAKNKCNAYCDRHIGINLLREKSVEIRIFKGTLVPDFFWKNIEFCKALYDFTFKTSLQHSCSLSLFRKFVKENCKEFMHLMWFMNLPVNMTLSEKDYTNEMSLL